MKGVVSHFLLYVLRTRINSTPGALSNAAHGTLKIDGDELRQIKIPLPAEHEQIAAVHRVESLLAKTQTLAKLTQQKLTVLGAWAAEKFSGFQEKSDLIEPHRIDFEGHGNTK